MITVFSPPVAQGSIRFMRSPLVEHLPMCICLFFCSGVSKTAERSQQIAQIGNGLAAIEKLILLVSELFLWRKGGSKGHFRCEQSFTESNMTAKRIYLSKKGNCDYGRILHLGNVMSRASSCLLSRGFQRLVLCFPCAYIVRPYLEINPHDKAQGLADWSMKKPILVHLILFSLSLKQFRLGASTVSCALSLHGVEHA